jgi:hypothetical protein
MDMMHRHVRTPGPHARRREADIPIPRHGAVQGAVPERHAGWATGEQESGTAQISQSELEIDPQRICTDRAAGQPPLLCGCVAYVDRQTDRQTDRQGGRQGGRQAGRRCLDHRVVVRDAVAHLLPSTLRAMSLRMRGPAGIRWAQPSRARAATGPPANKHQRWGWPAGLLPPCRFAFSSIRLRSASSARPRPRPRPRPAMSADSEYPEHWRSRTSAAHTGRCVCGVPPRLSVSDGAAASTLLREPSSWRSTLPTMPRRCARNSLRARQRRGPWREHTTAWPQGRQRSRAGRSMLTIISAPRAGAEAAPSLLDALFLLRPDVVCEHLALECIAFHLLLQALRTRVALDGQCRRWERRGRFTTNGDERRRRRRQSVELSGVMQCAGGGKGAGACWCVFAHLVALDGGQRRLFWHGEVAHRCLAALLHEDLE